MLTHNRVAVKRLLPTIFRSKNPQNLAELLHLYTRSLLFSNYSLPERNMSKVKLCHLVKCFLIQFFKNTAIKVSAVRKVKVSAVRSEL